MFNLGASEIAVILVVALLFLGPKMLPEIATALGKIIREFRKATADIRQDIELDDVIRKPLQELRDAATLPPEELKRRDELKAARQKAELAAKEEELRRKREVEDAERKQREEAKAAEAAAKREEEAKQAAEAAAKREEAAKLAAAQAAAKQAEAAKASVHVAAKPGEAITANGTMVASPPPAEDLQTLTPLPDLYSPPPVVGSPGHHLPPPLPPPPAPRPTGPIAASDATVIDLNAQLKATVEAQKTIAGRPGPLAARAPKPANKRDENRRVENKKDESKKG